MNRVDVVVSTTPPPREAAAEAADAERTETPGPDVVTETKPAKRRRASATPTKPAQREKE